MKNELLKPKNYFVTTTTAFKKTGVLACLCLTSALFSACEKSPAPVVVETLTAPVSAIEPEAVTAVNHVWQKAAAQIQACTDSHQQLRQQIVALLNQPSDQTLLGARQAWHQSHNHFLSLSVFFAIAESNPGLFGSLNNLHYALDGQPIQPGFIDYFDVYRQSGIVNDMAITLSAEALRQQHGITDLTDISIGFHAMEYLLWGEQGQRPLSDFEAQNNVNAEQAELGLRPVDLPNNRRRVYLQLIAELLIDDCANLIQYWNDQNQDLWRNYQQLQTGSRLQLWQAAVATTTEQLKQLIEHQAQEIQDDSEADAAPSSTADDGMQAAHNQFARDQAGAIAATLSGLATLLFNHGQSQPSEPALSALAPWILPGLRPVTAGVEDNNRTSDENDADNLEGESAEETASVTTETLHQAFQTVLSDLNSDPSWPLAAPIQQSLLELLETIDGLLTRSDPAE